MDKNKIKNLIEEIRAKLIEIENEFEKTELQEEGSEVFIDETKEFKRMRYNVRSKGNLEGGPNGFTKIGTFEYIVKELAKNKTFAQLNEIFSKNKFPSGFKSNEYIVLESDLVNATDDKLKRYSKEAIVTIDGQKIQTLNQWGQYLNVEKETPGNFPVLEDIAFKLGFEITPVDKES